MNKHGQAATEDEYVSINASKAHVGEIGALRAVLTEISGYLESDQPIPKPLAKFLAEALSSVAKGLEGIRTYHRDHFYTDEPRKIAAIRKKRKAALDSCGRVFIRAFHLADSPGRPSTKSRFRMTPSAYMYAHLRSSGEAERLALEKTAMTYGVNQGTLANYLKAHKPKPDYYTVANNVHAMGRLVLIYIRNGFSEEKAITEVAALRNLSTNATKSSLRIFRENGLIALLGRDERKDEHLEELLARIASESNYPIGLVRRAQQKRHRYDLKNRVAEAVIQRQAAGVDEHTAVLAVTEELGLKIKTVEDYLHFSHSKVNYFYLFGRRFFRERKEIARLIRAT